MVGRQEFVTSGTSYCVILVLLHHIFRVMVAIDVLCCFVYLAYDVEVLVYVRGSASDHMYFRVSVLVLCASTSSIRLSWRSRVVGTRAENRKSPWLRLSYERSRSCRC
jgi:hypothetical protein